MAVLVLPGEAPPAPVSAPHLPFAADPGTITGWLLDATATKTSSSISREMEGGLNRLVDNIPELAADGYDEVMRDMADEIINSDTLILYLVASNSVNGEVWITVIHSIKRYSAGFGGNNALHGKTLGLLREVMDTQLPPLIWFHQDPNHNLLHALRNLG
jgi:hypothetical protein